MATASKTRIFIGSSVERLDIAYAVQQELEYSAESTVWTQGIFEPSGTTMHSLLRATRENDAAIFVFAADDVAKIRSTTSNVVRDNVLFELGLFIGALGVERVYFLVARGSDFHLPTDLLGVTPLSFEPNRSDANLRAAVGPACHAVRTSLGRFSGRPQRDSAGADQLNEDDAIEIVRAWIDREIADVLQRVHAPEEIDRNLRLPLGTTHRVVEQAVGTGRRNLEIAVNSPLLLQFRSKT